MPAPADQPLHASAAAVEGRLEATQPTSKLECKGAGVALGAGVDLEPCGSADQPVARLEAKRSQQASSKCKGPSAVLGAACLLNFPMYRDNFAICRCTKEAGDDSCRQNGRERLRLPREMGRYEGRALASNFAHV
eukprot:scaffold29688_cov17-Tisochrysis_lutea.AAC.1